MVSSTGLSASRAWSPPSPSQGCCSAPAPASAPRTSRCCWPWSSSSPGSWDSDGAALVTALRGLAVVQLLPHRPGPHATDRRSARCRHGVPPVRHRDRRGRALPSTTRRREWVPPQSRRVGRAARQRRDMRIDAHDERSGVQRNRRGRASAQGADGVWFEADSHAMHPPAARILANGIPRGRTVARQPRWLRSRLRTVGAGGVQWATLLRSIGDCSHAWTECAARRPPRRRDRRPATRHGALFHLPRPVRTGRPAELIGYDAWHPSNESSSGVRSRPTRPIISGSARRSAWQCSAPTPSRRRPMRPARSCWFWSASAGMGTTHLLKPIAILVVVLLALVANSLPRDHPRLPGRWRGLCGLAGEPR